MNIISISILQDILIIVGIVIMDWITNSIVIEEKQKYVKLFTTIIGLTLILYMTLKLSISVSKMFPIGGF